MERRDNNLGIGNIGDYNRGNYNIGDHNSGNCNKGDRNNGNFNTGNDNIGSHNSGHWNKCSYSNGCFNTAVPKIQLFNKPSDWTLEDLEKSAAWDVLNRMDSNLVMFVRYNAMKVEEQMAHPEAKTTDGYLEELTERDLAKGRQAWWDRLSDEEKEAVKSLPNFDSAIFKEITGIDMEKGE